MAEKILSKIYGVTRKLEILKNNENLFCLKIIDLSSEHEQYTSTFLTKTQIEELLVEIKKSL
jgi:hypothetical protein